MRGYALGLSLGLAGALGAACVPASETDAPKGAAGFASDPSPATRGEPFSTNDGWTISFTRVAVMANISVISANPMTSGSAERWEWNAAMHAEPFARAVGIGPAAVSVTLQGLGLPARRRDDVSRVNVDDETDALFRVAADDDNTYATDDRYRDGPSLVFAVEARKNERTIALALGVVGAGGNALPLERTHTLVVRQDELTVLPLLIAAEKLFVEGSDPYTGDFDFLANGDADADGRLTPDELTAIPIDCETCSVIGSPPENALMLLSSRASLVLVAQ